MKLNKIKLSFKIRKPTLALGAQTKNTVCFGEDNFVYLSPLHQDLSNPEDLLAFEKDVRLFLKRNPKIIAYDLHPEYQSTKYAFNLTPNTYHLSPIQHHHAHIAGCMAENNLKNEKVIGVAFDGTGLGSDNNLWGAEFFICDYRGFKRVSHLKEIPLLGSEKAILEPARLVLAWLYLIYKDKFLDLKLDWVKKADRKEWRALKNIYLSGFNSPLTSSMGRLFDAVGSLVSGRRKANFEAELAMELENIAQRHQSQITSHKSDEISYKFGILKGNDGYIIDPASLFKQIIVDLEKREPKGKIAYKFHLTVAEMIRKICVILRRAEKINKVVLSGGVFQNNLLLSLTLDLLYKEGFKVFTHKNLSCNDSGISLGQVAISNYRS